MITAVTNLCPKDAAERMIEVQNMGERMFPALFPPGDTPDVVRVAEAMLELLAACKSLIAAFDPPSKLGDSLIRVETDAIRDAIAKAEGVSQ